MLLRGGIGDTGDAGHRNTVGLGLEGRVFTKQTSPRVSVGHSHAGHCPGLGPRGATG